MAIPVGSYKTKNGQKYKWTGRQWQKVSNTSRNVNYGKKPTSSGTRSTGKGATVNRRGRTVTQGRGVTTKPVSTSPRGAQGPATAPVQGPYRKTNNIVFEIPGKTKKKPAGPPVTKKVKPTTKVKVKTNTKGGGNNLRTTAAAGLVTAAAVGSLRNPVSKAKKREASKSIGNYNTRDGDGKVRSRKKVGPKIVGPKKVGPKKVGTIAESFDKAFAAARKAGKKTFTFKGKLYSTKMAK